MTHPLDAPMDFLAEDSILPEVEVVEDTLVSFPVLVDLSRGQMSSNSHGEFFYASMPPRFHGSLSSKAWVVEAVKVKDDWSGVKRKKAKSFVPPLDMILWLCKVKLQMKRKILCSLMLTGFLLTVN